MSDPVEMHMSQYPVGRGKVGPTQGPISQGWRVSVSISLSPVLRWKSLSWAFYKDEGLLGKNSVLLTRCSKQGVAVSSQRAAVIRSGLLKYLLPAREWGLCIEGERGDLESVPTSENHNPLRAQTPISDSHSIP